VTSPRPASGLRPALTVAASAVVSGIGSYVLLIVVAKNVSATAYAEFAVFWSIAVTVGLGAYYPVEQETARDFAGRERRPGGRLRRVAFGFAAILTAVLVAAAVVLLAFPAAVSFVGSAGLLLALGVAFLGYTAQFPARGILSGARITDGYASIVSLEGVLRIALPLGVALLGFTDPAVFALTVGVAAALSAGPAALRRFRVDGSPDARMTAFSSRALRLIVAALAIQLLLNSGVLIARSLDGAEPALAGQILTSLSIARIPVFAYQALQVLYMPRLAAAWKAGDHGAARRTILFVAGAIVLVGVVAVLGMFWLGPWAIGLFFTPELVLATGPLVLLTAGVSVFLLAQALSDAALACGGHTVLVSTWIGAAIVAGVSVALIPDPALRAVAPLLIGSAVAVASFSVFLVTRLRRAAPSGFSPEHALR
jgi:O-antigen/teichoic acid export membrane protein